MGVMSFLLGILSLTCFGISTFLWFIPLFIVAILKLAIPIPAWRRSCNVWLDCLAWCWVESNNIMQDISGHNNLEIQGTDGLSTDAWYLIMANHVSWVDIVVLQRVFNRKIPFMKFFLKKELIYVPLLGFAWWALDFPFMQRFSRAYLEKNPHLKGSDLETTRAACEVFKNRPTSIVNFPEGTRITKKKHSDSSSPYKHLLKPKVGGIAFTLAAMGQKMDKVLDVTIGYPEGAPGIWSYMCGDNRPIKVVVKLLEPENKIAADYFTDDSAKDSFQKWMNQIWKDKDVILDGLLSSKKRL